MGRGSSKAGGGNKGGGGNGSKYDEFMAMSDDEKADALNTILNDRSVQVPSYLDDSHFTKALYGLGITNKPEVYDDDAIDSMSGTEIFRTVYDAPNGVTADMIFDQIANGDYTMMSGRNSSVHGRSLYFAESFSDSASYGAYDSSSMIMRAKYKPGAKIANEYTLKSEMASAVARGDKLAIQCQKRGNSAVGLYALSKGYDAYTDGWGYNMIVNRGALAMSRTAKKTNGNTSGGWSDYSSTVNLK